MREREESGHMVGSPVHSIDITDALVAFIAQRHSHKRV